MYNIRSVVKWARGINRILLSLLKLLVSSGIIVNIRTCAHILYGAYTSTKLVKNLASISSVPYQELICLKDLDQLTQENVSIPNSKINRSVRPP